MEYAIHVLHFAATGLASTAGLQLLVKGFSLSEGPARWLLSLKFLC